MALEMLLKYGMETITSSKDYGEVGVTSAP